MFYFDTLLHRSKLRSPSPNLGEELDREALPTSCSPKLGELAARQG